MRSVSSVGIFFFILLHKGLEAVKTTSVAPVKDFNYTLDGGRLQSMQISQKGFDFVVGSQPQRLLENTNENTVMKCVLHRIRRDINRFTPWTRVVLKQDADDKVLTTATFFQYFVVTKKEIWLCNTLNNEPRASFTRIVTELIARHEVNRVFYHDGVKVTTKPFTNESRTAVITEIKYYDSYKDEILRYDGKLELPETHEFIMPYLRLAFKVGKRQNIGSAGQFTEIVYGNANLPIIRRLRSAGDVIELGQSVSETLGAKESIAECKKYQGIQAEFPFAFRTHIKLNGKNLTQNNYTQYFTPIREEVWLCKYDQVQFWRVINEFVSVKLNLGTLKYFDQVTNLAELTTAMIRFKTITYHTYNNINQQKKYLGYITLKSPEIDQELKVLKSFNKQLLGTGATEMSYVLEPGRVFKSSVSGHGFSLRIGSPYTTIVGSESDVVECEQRARNETYSFDYGTKFHLVLRRGNKYVLKALSQRKQAEYWYLGRQQVWYCKKSADVTDVTFLRIVNELKGKTELYDVEYYDNVQLYSRFIRVSQRSVNLIEIKYISLDNSQVYKYEGKVKLKSAPKQSTSFIDCRNCQGQLIRRAVNEIVFEKGVFKNRHLSEGELGGETIEFTCKDGQVKFSSSWNPTAPLSIIIGEDPAVLIKVGNKEDILDCEEFEKRRDEFHSYMEINSKENPAIFKPLPVSERALVLKLELLEQRVWLCDQVDTEFNKNKMKFQLYRVYNNYKIGQELREIKVRDGIKVTSVEESGRNFTETKYLLTNFTGAKYEGAAVIYPKLTNVEVRSGTFLMPDNDDVDRKFDSSIDIPWPAITKKKYVNELEKKRIHKLTVQESGQRIVELGKRWTKQHKLVYYTDNIKHTPVKHTANIKPNCSHTVRRYRRQVLCHRNRYISSRTYKKQYKPYCKTLDPKDQHKNYSGSQLFDNYFILKSWEIWDCHELMNVSVSPTWNEMRGPLLFRRVVSDFELKQPQVQQIKEIHYQDGITVYRGDKVLGGYGWFFHEIRYVLPNSPEITYKYPYQVKLIREHIDAQLAGEFTHSNLHTCLMNLAERSMSYQLGSDQMFDASSSSSYNRDLALKVGESNYDKVISDDRTFLCNEITNDYIYRYEMKVQVSGKKPPFFQYKIRPSDELRFKEEPHHLWECKPLEQSSPDITLLRVKRRLNNEIMYRNYVQQVKFYDGFTVPADLKFIEQIMYFDDTDKNKPVKPVKFDGFVILDRFHELDKQMSTEMEIDYVLDFQLIYVKEISKKGTIAIEINRGWNADDPSVNYTATCFISKPVPAQKEMRTLFKTIDVKENMYKTLNYDDGIPGKFHQNREAVRCTSPQIGEFLRVVVVTMIEDKSDVLHVYYPDGVTMWTDDQKLFIREEKFWNIINSQVFKFEGEITYK